MTTPTFSKPACDGLLPSSASSPRVSGLACDLENLTKAQQSADLLLNDLRQCYADADPVCEMLLRPMLPQVVAIHDTLRAIVASRAGAKCLPPPASTLRCCIFRA